MTAVIPTADSPDTPVAARRRHPSARSPIRSPSLRDRLAVVLELDGAIHADVAAAVLEVRGLTGLDVGGFARRAGVAVDVVRRAEAGLVRRDQLPGALRRMVPPGR